MQAAVLRASLLLAIATDVLAGGACDLHVSAAPGALAAAVGQLAAALRATRRAGDYEICLEPGDHLLEGEHLRLDASHNHPRGSRVIWRGREGAPKPRVSAGVRLDKWQRCDAVAPGTCGGGGPGTAWSGVWVHRVDDIPNVTGADVPFRQLWVGGRRVTRRAVAGGSLGLKATAGGYSVGGGSNASLDWVRDQVELRWPSQIKNWIEPRCVLSAVSGRQLTVEPGCWASLTKRNDNQPAPPPAFLENVAGPPGPGEFYATLQHVFYRPFGADPDTAPADAFAPLGGCILEGSNLTNHSFVGLHFAHATWRQPSAPGGLVETQSLVTGAAEPAGAVRFARCRDLVVDGCEFRDVGAAYALSVGGASQNVSVTSSVFEDLSGGAVKMGNVDDRRAVMTDPEQFDAGYSMRDCEIQGVAVEFRGAAAVFAGYVAQTRIEHNTIADAGYTGISLGWGWGSHVEGPPTFMADNHIRFNRLSNVMMALNDGGCTYTLGPQPGSSVEGNVCAGDRARVVGCFYHDNGSRYFLTKDNVADSSPAPCVYLQGCCNAPALDVAVSRLWCRSTAPAQNGCAPQNCSIDKATLFYLPTGAAWPPPAQSIIDAAGARRARADGDVTPAILL